MIRRKMWSLAFGLVCVGMALSVSGHAGWAPQRAVQVASMSGLELPGLKKPITKRFVNTSLGEVLAWLSLEQFSFVADAGEFPGKGQVTLSFKGQPLGAVLDAIADAFNGRWEQRGEIFTLRPRDSFRGSFGVAERVANTQSETSVRAGTAEKTTTIAPPSAFAPVQVPRSTSGVGRLNTPTFQFAPLPTLPSSSGVRGTSPALLPPSTGTVRSVQGQLVPQISRIAPPSVFTGPNAPVRAFNAPPAIASTRSLMPPTAGLTTPFVSRAYSPTVQGSQERQEALRQAEQAMKMAEEAIRRMHESGEWQKAMEKAMSAARSHQNSDEMRKAMEEVRRAMQNMPRSDEWRKAWEEARAAMRKALQDGKVTKDGKERPMTDKEKQAISKALDSMKDFQMPKMEKFDFVMPKIDQKAFVMPPMKMDESFMKEHKLQMEKLMKELPKMEGRAFVMPPMKLDEKAMKQRELQMEKLMKELPKMEGRAFAMPKLEGLPEGRLFGIDSRRMRINELLDSLTPAQKEKQAKQGHLTLADLTPRQREMLGDVPAEGNWTFSYSIEGKKLTVKNK